MCWSRLHPPTTLSRAKVRDDSAFIDGIACKQTLLCSVLAAITANQATTSNRWCGTSEMESHDGKTNDDEGSPGVFITAVPITKLFARGGGGMEDMCYERLRAKAGVN